MISSEAINFLHVLMQWIIAPVAAFVWFIYQKQQAHNTQIAVLQAETASARLAHDREIKEIRETSRAIMAKLDSIEEALRK
jgi:predicted negative regulator of RcsB-dependent stress response